MTMNNGPEEDEIFNNAVWTEPEPQPKTEQEQIREYFDNDVTSPASDYYQPPND